MPFVFLNCICSDASFGYPGGPLLFKNLNFGIDLDSRIASKDFYLNLPHYFLILDEIKFQDKFDNVNMNFSGVPY